MANTNIVTGQYVTLSQMPASLGDRIVARLIDYVILIAYSIVVGIIVWDMKLYDEMSRNAYVALMLALYLSR